ncbi:unnamed protein product [Phytophthora fragariaefolia]|uniref:Unnamed protein product n=1 Tax=Phytophthora fragariaefolia TaxID=1490495 RepID=A0A9W7CYX5_9STRA|nr:unnamed protein product [Phytophthora fragariaefolia]
MKYMNSGNEDAFEYEGNEIHFEDYAHELAFLPDLTVPASTILDYDAPNVKNPTLDPFAQLKLVETLCRHDEIMIASEDVLPPPAYVISTCETIHPSSRELVEFRSSYEPKHQDLHRQVQRRQLRHMEPLHAWRVPDQVGVERREPRDHP